VAIPLVARIAAGALNISSGRASDKISISELAKSAGDIDISIDDKVTPFLTKNKAGKLYKNALKVSLRRTAAHFRRQLKFDIGFKVGNKPEKKVLDAEGKRRFLANLPRLAKEGWDISKLRRRHLHRTNRPWQKSIKNTITYQRLSNDVLSYAYGFTGRTKSGGVSKTAIQFGEALQEGLFIDPKTRRMTRAIDGNMSKYFEAIGLKTSKSHLDFPKRKVIAPFFRSNKSNMFKYFARRYEEMARDIQKKADNTKPKRETIKIA
jgi:hypothetical protein